MGSFTSAGGHGITTATADPDTGALTALATTGSLPDPSYLALDPDGGPLYAVSETARGAAAAFARTPEGLRPLGPTTPVGGDGPTHLSVAGPWLLTAHYASGGVSTLPRAADGSLGGPPRVLDHHGSGPDPDRQKGPHAHQILPSPDGRWVLSVDLGTDSLWIAALDPGDGTLTPHSETALRPGTGPRHLAFHPGGRLLYVLHELEPVLTVCHWDPATGTAVPATEVRVADHGPDGARAYPSALVADPAGRFLWAAVRGTDTLVVLALDPAGTDPRPTATVDCGGTWPRDLALDPAGRRLYAANERSGDVTWFAIDPADGRPVRSGSLALPAPTCVVLARP
ncbi:lactonase family protein [Streptomyces sp. NPDC097619]|uniref:lactonase family protein n=1 Tax=Streptomyces sp. NPDC097619 TaxID=3157228 RepID=UPI003331288B